VKKVYKLLLLKRLIAGSRKNMATSNNLFMKYQQERQTNNFQGRVKTSGALEIKGFEKRKLGSKK